MDRNFTTGIGPKYGAIILGGHVNSLGIIRSLGIKEVPCYVVDSSSFCIARYSKYCLRFIKCNQMDREDFLMKSLISLSKKHSLKNWVLFPTNDREVRVLSKHKKELSEHYIISVDNWDRVKIAYDKSLTNQFAQSLDVCFPKTQYIEQISDIEKFKAREYYPLIIKPKVMHTFYKLLKKKAIKVGSYEELKKQMRIKLKGFIPNQLMFQEIIPGPVTSIYSFCSFTIKGVVKEWYINRHLEQIPHDFGKVATKVQICDNKEVEIISKKILKKLSYTGPSEIEFKFDERNNTYMILDFNPRFWKQNSLGLCISINIPYSCYCYLTGQKVDNKNNKNNKNNFNTIWYDIVMASNVKIHKLNPFKKKNYDAGAFINRNRNRNRKIFAVLDKNDIKPFIMFFLYLPILFFKR